MLSEHPPHLVEAAVEVAHVVERSGRGDEIDGVIPQGQRFARGGREHRTRYHAVGETHHHHDGLETEHLRGVGLNGAGRKTGATPEIDRQADASLAALREVLLDDTRMHGGPRRGVADRHLRSRKWIRHDGRAPTAPKADRPPSDVTKAPAVSVTDSTTILEDAARLAQGTQNAAVRQGGSTGGRIWPSASGFYSSGADR